jgi:hypothetical protein
LPVVVDVHDETEQLHILDLVVPLLRLRSRRDQSSANSRDDGGTSSEEARITILCPRNSSGSSSDRREIWVAAYYGGDTHSSGSGLTRRM